MTAKPFWVPLLLATTITAWACAVLITALNVFLIVAQLVR